MYLLRLLRSLHQLRHARPRRLPLRHARPRRPLLHHARPRPPCYATRGHDALCCAMRSFFTDFSCAMRGTVATHGFILPQWS